MYFYIFSQELLPHGSIQTTKNKELTKILKRIVFTCSDEQLLPVAVVICQHLRSIFCEVIDEEKHTAKEVLKTVVTLFERLEDYGDVKIQLEPLLAQVLSLI